MKIVAGYVAVGFVIMEVLYLGVWCRPFNQYWAVPPNSSMTPPLLGRTTIFHAVLLTAF